MYAKYSISEKRNNPRSLFSICIGVMRKKYIHIPTKNIRLLNFSDKVVNDICSGVFYVHNEGKAPIYFVNPENAFSITSFGIWMEKVNIPGLKIKLEATRTGHVEHIDDHDYHELDFEESVVYEGRNNKLRTIDWGHALKTYASYINSASETGRTMYDDFYELANKSDDDLEPRLYDCYLYVNHRYYVQGMKLFKCGNKLYSFEDLGTEF